MSSSLKNSILSQNPSNSTLNEELLNSLSLSDREAVVYTWINEDLANTEVTNQELNHINIYKCTVTTEEDQSKLEAKH